MFLTSAPEYDVNSSDDYMKDLSIIDFLIWFVEFSSNMGTFMAFDLTWNSNLSSVPRYVTNGNKWSLRKLW